MSTSKATRTRADRLQLIAKLERARDAAGLLRSKEEALEREHGRLKGYAARAEAEWQRRSRIATTRLVRARMLGASDELRVLVGQAGDLATVRTHWQASMGILYPGSVECTPGATPPMASTSALGPAVQAYREALDAAGTSASTNAAVDRLDAELLATRRRRRAIEERLQPDLERSVTELELHLDELDREEALRVHAANTLQEVARPC